MATIEEPSLVPYRPSDPCGVSALVLAPHPDDETIGCGGTIALQRAAGDDVHVVVLTDGAAGLSRADQERDAYVALREGELSAAVAALGDPRLTCWRLPDRGLDAQREVLRERLRGLIEAERPGRIYCPSPLEVAPDHIACWRALAEVLTELPERPELWAYEIWVALLPDRLVDVTGVWPAKEAALAAYASQHDPVDISRLATHLAGLRSLTAPARVRWAEAFTVVAPETPGPIEAWRRDRELQQLHRQLEQARQALAGAEGKLRGALDRLAALDRDHARAIERESRRDRRLLHRLARRWRGR